MSTGWKHGVRGANRFTTSAGALPRRPGSVPGLLVLGLVLGLLVACTGGDEPTTAAPPTAANRAVSSPAVPLPPDGSAAHSPLPPAPVLDARKVALGKRLFYDPRLSKNGKLSCAICHDPDTGGMDGRPRSTRFDGGPTKFNTPTVFNAAYSFRIFWDGRAASLEEQVLMEGNLGMVWQEAPKLLAAIPEYAKTFAALYPDGITLPHIADAIATYERTLTTPGSRFDRHLGGDATALSSHEKEGYRLFIQLGCASCHQGVNVGGNLYQKFGLFGDYFAERGGALTPQDLGRYSVTKLETDRQVFRVPSLRNVAVTAPYFHDGSAESLDLAVSAMARYQLGRHLPLEQIEKLVVFLGSLTGEYQGKPLVSPQR